MKAGFIGLGNLGKSMARRLIDTGVELIVYNRTKEKANGLKAQIADTAADVITNREITFLCLTDSSAVKSLMYGQNSITSANLSGKIIIDATTNHYNSVVEFYNLMKSKGASYIECPVLGSVIHALTGTLKVFVSGDREAFKKAMPYMRLIAKDVFYLKEPSKAAKMKLLSNLNLAVFMVCIGESISLAQDAGIDKEQAINLLCATGAGSYVFSAKKSKLISEDFSAHFTSSLLYKDLTYALELAGSLKSPLFTASLANELYGLCFSNNMSALDFSSIYKLIRGNKI
ncbi:6-phosphogluconate dehydrogenase [Candidatus Magnetoovum chiemensis]|nr:6-phosphogluconate dehydrogenase [Candidatus Magnetoovum chiemensis]